MQDLKQMLWLILILFIYFYKELLHLSLSTLNIALAFLHHSYICNKLMSQ